MATIGIFKHEEETVSFSSGQTLFKEGESGDLMYVVQAGKIEILVNNSVVETAGEGAIVGEMALIDTSSRSATAVAKTDCTLVPLDEQKFLYHVRRTPFFALQVMRIMADRLRHLDQYLSDSNVKKS